MSSQGNTYKPSEHDGLKKDGTPDKRTQSDHGFGSAEGNNEQEITQEDPKLYICRV